VKKTSVFLGFLIVMLAFPLSNSVKANPDETFGNTNIGATWETFFTDRIYGCKYDLLEDGDVTKITMWFQTAAIHIRFAIYTENAGSPNTLLAETAEGSTVANNWVSIAITKSLTAGTYWLCWRLEDSSASKKDAGGVNQEIGSASGQGYGAFPGAFPTVGSAKFNYAVSIYATYTPSGGGQDLTFVLYETCGISDTLEIGKEKASFLDESCGVDLQTVIGKEKGSYFSETTLTSTETGIAKEKLILLSPSIGILSEMDFSKEVAMYFIELFETCNITDLLGITKEKLLTFSDALIFSSILEMTKEQKLKLIEIFETVLVTSQIKFISQIAVAIAEIPIHELVYAALAIAIIALAAVFLYGGRR